MNQAIRTTRDSGIASIGPIPADWELAAARRFLRLKKHLVGKRSDDFELLSLTKQGVILRDLTENKGKFPESFDTYQSVQKGDLVLCLFDIDETPRTVGLSAFEGMVTGAYSVFHCATEWYRDYLYLLLLHLDDAKGLKPFYSGLRKTIRPPEFLSIRFPVPSQDEARAICDHVSAETARIDALIEKKTRFIELLKEKRQALITQAVTKGLDPNVPMRDSGVKWIGEVPEGWGTCRVWMKFALGRGRVISHEEIHENPGDYPVYSSQTKNDGEMGKLGSYDFEGDYLTWTTDGAHAGTVFRRSGRFNCTNVCGTLKPHGSDVSLGFMRNAIDTATNWFVRHDINPKLMNDVMASIHIPLPTPEEQAAIDSMISQQTDRMQVLEQKTMQSIELLKERRSALITAAVTGQIDLRGAA